MNGYEKAKAMADKVKEEKEQTEELALENKQVIRNQLATLAENSELAKMYADNAQVGADNLSGELPYLKVHSVGKSSKNELADGSEPKDGYFFYKPTGEQFEEITCHVLTISKGFKSPGLEDNGKEVFNQILGGVIIDGTEYKPFIMFFTGLKLSYLWEFGKAANKYTHAKPVPIPMFALTVKFTTSKVDNSYGKSWVVTLSIVKQEDGAPSLVLDPGEFQFLKTNVDEMEATIASLITAKTEKTNGQAVNGEVIEDHSL